MHVFRILLFHSGTLCLARYQSKVWTGILPLWHGRAIGKGMANVAKE